MSGQLMCVLAILYFTCTDERFFFYKARQNHCKLKSGLVHEVTIYMRMEYFLNTFEWKKNESADFFTFILN